MALYRPGQSRLSSRMRQDREEGADTSSSSPSPVMPAGDQKKSLPSTKETTEDSSKSDSKEDAANTRSDADVSAEDKSALDEEDKDESNIEENKVEDIVSVSKEKNENDDEKDGSVEFEQTDDNQKVNEETDSSDRALSFSSEAPSNAEASGGSMSKETKKYPGVKTMTFRRSVSRE